MKTDNPVQYLIHGYDSIQWGLHFLDLLKAEQTALLTWAYRRDEGSRNKYFRIREQVNNYPERPQELTYEKI